jgi:hypothetical protein
MAQILPFFARFGWPVLVLGPANIAKPLHFQDFLSDIFAGNALSISHSTLEYPTLIVYCPLFA